MIDKLKLIKESEWEGLFYEQLEGDGLHEDVEWHRIVEGHETDFCWFDLHIIVEIQGGTEGFGRGRGAHVREPQYSKDRRFSNACQMEGWWVLEFSAPMVRNGEALETIRDALERRQTQ